MEYQKTGLEILEKIEKYDDLERNYLIESMMVQYFECIQALKMYITLQLCVYCGCSYVFLYGIELESQNFLVKVHANSAFPSLNIATILLQSKSSIRIKILLIDTFIYRA